MRTSVARANVGGHRVAYLGDDYAFGSTVHVFTDAELGRDGHVSVYEQPVTGLDPARVTHVAIPVEQYVRIFGEL